MNIDMKLRSLMILSVAVVVVAFTAVSCGEESTVAKKEKPLVGDMAPDFELPGSDGKTYTLEQFRDRQVVVIAWFPKAFTGG